MTPRPIVSVVVPILLFLINTVGTGQVQKDPSRHRLLWRITGPGMPGTSYLFGTMHVRDERAFAFGDSVLPALRRCEAFAMEVDMDSVQNAMMEGQFETTDDSSITSVKEKIRAWARDAILTTPLDKRIETVFDNITIGRKPMPLHRDDYPLWLDLYLERLAKAEGKECHGLENVNTVRSYLSILFEGPDGDSALPVMSNTEMTERQLRTLALYEQGDVEGLYVNMGIATSSGYMDAIIHRRNEGMIGRIAELLKKESTFIAVGAAHLSGEQGLIPLLRKRGFMVEPVIQTFQDSLPPRNPPFMPYGTHIFRTTDSILSFISPIPLQPAPTLVREATLSRLPMNGEMFVGADAVRQESISIIHFTGLMRQANSSNTGVLGDIVEGMSTDVDTVLSAEERIIAGKSVFQINAIRKNIQLTILVARTESTMSLILLTQRDRDVSLRDYLEQSLTIGESVRIDESWEVYIDETLGFSVDMPKAAVIRSSKDAAANVRLLWQRMYTEGSGASTLMVQITDLMPGYGWSNESFRSLPDIMATAMGAEIADTANDELQGYPHCRARLTKKGETVCILHLVVRDGRMYLLLGNWMAEHGKASVDRFMSSFRLRPLQRTQDWPMTACMDSTLILPLPTYTSGLESEHRELIGRTIGTYRQDTVSNVMWFVGRVLFPEYQTFDGSIDAAMDTVLTRAGLIDSMTTVDTTIIDGAIRIREIHRRLNQGFGMFVQRTFFCGTELYVLSSLITMPTYRDRQLWSAPLDAMTCRCSSDTVTRFTSKAAQLFADVTSDDSVRNDRAMEYLRVSTMNPSDYDVYMAQYRSWVKDRTDSYVNAKEYVLADLFRHDAARTRKALLALADSTIDVSIRADVHNDAVSYRETASIRLLDSLVGSGTIPDTTWSLDLFRWMLTDSTLIDPFASVAERYYLRPKLRDLYIMTKGIQYGTDRISPNKDKASIDKVERILTTIMHEMDKPPFMMPMQELRRQYSTIVNGLSLLWYHRHEKKVLGLMKSLIMHPHQDVGLEAIRNLATAGQRLDVRSIRRFCEDAGRRMSMLRLCDSTRNISVIPKPILADASLMEGLIVEEVQRVSQDPYDEDSFDETAPLFGEKGYRPPSSIVVKDYQEENPDYRGRWILVKFRTNLPYGPDVWYAGIAGPFFPDMRGHIGKLSFVTKYEAFDDYDADEHARLLMEFKVGQDTYEEVDDE